MENTNSIIIEKDSDWIAIRNGASYSIKIKSNNKYIDISIYYCFKILEKDDQEQYVINISGDFNELKDIKEIKLAIIENLIDLGMPKKILMVNKEELFILFPDRSKFLDTDDIKFFDMDRNRINNRMTGYKSPRYISNNEEIKNYFYDCMKLYKKTKK